MTGHHPPPRSAAHTPTFTCAGCGDVRPRVGGSLQRWCSRPECQRKAKRPARLDPTHLACERCGQQFRRRNSAQRLCSKRCQVAVSARKGWGPPRGWR